MPKRILGKSVRGGHSIKQWREHRGLTQEQLAERLDTSAASLSRIENFKQPYTQDFLEACAAALRCEPVDLIVRNPLDPDGIWSIWDRAKPGERQQIVEIARVVTKTA